MPSHEPKVDYSLRPAKAIERRMLVEVVGRVGRLHSPRAYRYIGMGSVYFQDFVLFHRRLGITDMLTIEGDASAEARIRFNLPLSCIDIAMGTTGAVLPTLDLAAKASVLWLDYESKVDSGVLGDIDSIVSRAAPASFLVITVNCARFENDEKFQEWRSQFEDFPEPAQPRFQREYELLSYRLLRDRILAALDARNAALPVAQRLQFQQAVHFAYRDGAPMLTVGGILVEQARTATLNECGIDELHFYRPDEESFSIELPKLTRREVHYLLREVPENPGDLSTAAQHVGVSVQDARKLANLYRYASLFVEADEV